MARVNPVKFRALWETVFDWTHRPSIHFNIANLISSRNEVQKEENNLPYYNILHITNM